MPEPQQKRRSLQKVNDGNNGPGLGSAEISDRTDQQIVIKQEVDIDTGNETGCGGPFADFHQSEIPIKLEGYSLTENGTDNHDLIAGSQQHAESNQAGIPVTTEGYSRRGSESGTDNHDLMSSQPGSSDKLVNSILKDVEYWPIGKPWKDRLVQGNLTIEDISGLMKRIKFTVWHPTPFLQLPIVQKGIVQSIIFKNSFPRNHAWQLINVIGNTIEKVEFSFEDKSCEDQQRQLFVLILKKCKNLRELVIDSSRDYSPDFLSQPSVKVVFKAKSVNTNKIITLPPADTIRSFSVNLAGFNDNCVNGLKQALLLLPKLEKLKLLGCRQEADFFSTILAGLCEYIEKYKSDIHLKKLSMSFQYGSSSSFQNEHLELFVSLLILCGKHGIALTGVPSIININRLLGLKNSHILLLQTNSPLFAEVFGKLTFDDQPLRYLDKLHALNIRKWDLNFNRSIGKDDISWLRTIKELEFLSLAYGSEINKANLQPSIAELELILSEGLSTVVNVHLKHNILDPIRAFRWSQYFPNLEMLIIASYQTTPTNLISQLTSLECLSNLWLDDLPCLDDNAFTVEQVNRFTASNGAPELAPAIACFKSLQVLRIFWCSKLTDRCLVNGISKCKTLEGLRIANCGSIKSQVGGSQ